MARIAVGGFQHETNTFAPSPATYDAFVQADGWPGLSQGPALPGAVAGANLPVSGFIAAAEALGHQIVPLVWCTAPPSAHVTIDAFERVTSLLLMELLAAGRVDAVYLDLHGAMVTRSLEDGEGEILRRVRTVIGDDVPLVASLDLHANVSREMINTADLLDAYRAYPHVDMAATGGRVAEALDRILAGEATTARAWLQLPFLTGLNWQCTLIEPALSLYAQLNDQAGDRRLLSLAFAQGFPLADIHDAGGAVFAYGTDAAAVESAVARLATSVSAREGEFAGRLWGEDDAIAHVAWRAATAGRPFLLADAQDNPGGGSNGDTVGLLRALVGADAQGAVVATLTDVDAAQASHRAGVGAELTLPLGAWSGMAGHEPLVATVEVERLGDGRFVGTGPMWGGSRIDLGPMALLRIKAGAQGVRVIVASKKLQAGDQAILRHVGIEPAEQKILALKSSVHFRADFAPIAEDILVVESPGPVSADPSKLPFRNLRPGVRLSPLGNVSAGKGSPSGR